MPPRTKLFVGMLPPNCDEKLRKLFEDQGEVTECTVMGSYAFVHMKKEEEATAAIAALNQYNLDGATISVERSTGERRAGERGRGRGRGGFRGGRGGYDGGDHGGYGDGYGGRGGYGGGYGGDPGYGAGGPMRDGRMERPPYHRDAYDYRSSPYERPAYDRRPYDGDRYGPPPPPPMRSGYYDDYDRRPPASYSYPRGAPYDRYAEPYDRPAPRGRSEPAGERRIPTVPLTYDRRPQDPYSAPRDPYYAAPAPSRDLLYPPRQPSPGARRGQSPPRYNVPRY